MISRHEFSHTEQRGTTGAIVLLFALGGIDFSWIVGVVVVSAVYYFAVRSRVHSHPVVAIAPD